MDRPSTFREAEVIRNPEATPTISVSDALGSAKRELVLFTPALLVTHGRFDRDPVQEFDSRYPSKDRPFCVDLKRDHEFFFRGLGICAPTPKHRKVNWDKRLYVIAKDRADECFAFLSGVAFSEPNSAYYGNTLSYDLLIKDPTSKITKALEVKIFGVLANDFIAYIENTFDCPRAVKIPIGPNFKLTEHVNSSSLLVSPVSEDPLNMRK